MIGSLPGTIHRWTRFRADILLSSWAKKIFCNSYRVHYFSMQKWKCYGSHVRVGTMQLIFRASKWKISKWRKKPLYIPRPSSAIFWREFYRSQIKFFCKSTNWSFRKLLFYRGMSWTKFYSCLLLNFPKLSRYIKYHNQIIEKKYQFYSF